MSNFFEVIDLSRTPQPSPLTVLSHDLKPTGEHYTVDDAVQAAAYAMSGGMPLTPDYVEKVRAVLFDLNGIE